MGAGISLPRLTLWFIVMSSGLTHGLQAAEVYRWEDETGGVHYSDRPQSPRAKKLEVRQGGSREAAMQEAARLERTQRMLDEYAMEREEREVSRAQAETEKAKRREHRA